MNQTMDEKKNEKDVPQKKVKKLRCFQCKKKLSLIYFTCQCGHVFCDSHLNRHSHNCSYNAVQEKKKEIEKNNPKIQPNKIKT